jgi:hypothetical protein
MLSCPRGSSRLVCAPAQAEEAIMRSISAFVLMVLVASPSVAEDFETFEKKIESWRCR